MGKKRKCLQQEKRKRGEKWFIWNCQSETGHRLVLCHLYSVCISHGKFHYAAVTNSPHMLEVQIINVYFSLWQHVFHCVSARGISRGLLCSFVIIITQESSWSSRLFVCFHTNWGSEKNLGVWCTGFYSFYLEVMCATLLTFHWFS